MKLQLVGPSNTSYSLAAAAQQSLNCYLESIEGGDGKGQYVLRGRPGIHLFKDLTVVDAGATPNRGLFAGGGRLFAAAGGKQCEVSSGGALVGSVHTISDDASHTPVQMLPNGTQLLTLAAQDVACDNGSGPTIILLPNFTGNVNTSVSGTIYSVAWVSGDTFDVGMTGNTILINAVGYTVKSVTNPNLLQITTTAGTQNNVAYSATPVLKGNTAIMVDGYFMVDRPGSRQINISGLNDGTAWAGLDYAYKEGYPDNLVAVWTEPPLVYLLGTESLELWRDTGDPSFPFQRIDGGFARVGLAARYSCASIMGKLHMLAGGTYGQTVAVRMEGATPVRISTHAVEEALKGQVFSGTNGVAYSYLERGHWFWVIQLASGDSWVYDATESARIGSPQWHERARWDGANWQPYLPRFHQFIPEWGTGQHIVADYASGKLYELNSNFFDDAGADIRMVRALAYVYSDNKRIYHRRLDFELETGTAATPLVVTLDWSDDRGQTWGTGAGVGTVRTLGPGVSGTYTTRYYAVGLGSSRGRVYRISIQGQGKIALIDATLDAEVGAS